MSKESSRKPFVSLGNELKALRQRLNETLAEVSGAVEIDIAQLADFELGQKRPSEDILMLLITHLGARDDEAVKLWELAGYDSGLAASFSLSNDENPVHNTNAIVSAADARIVYTDMVHIMVNPYGVVLNFLQGGGPGSQPLAVSRVGMSREHAKSVLAVLKATLEQSDAAAQKQIPPATSSDK